MSNTGVIAHCRVDGSIKYTYGPFKFNTDWGGTFKALEIANYLEKISISSPEIGSLETGAELVTNIELTNPDASDWLLSTTSAKYRNAPGVTDKAENVAFRGLLRDLEYLTMDLEHLQISMETVKRLTGNDFDGQMIRLGTGQGKRPALLISEALVDMQIGGWPYLRQIVRALGKFAEVSTERDNAHRCMHMFFTA
ncbi:hypothetical protein PQR53_01755 [Paraburkholderia fungorum]|uniref:hypothetical protein n=1 Tax=Paraburkholderia fungorum TaxID=134537 RepID=UPI0038BCBBDB